MKVFVQKVQPARISPKYTIRMLTIIPQDGELRKAEILAIQTVKAGLRFYVHYDEFNKRLDEYVLESRLDLSREAEWSVPAPQDDTAKPATGPNSKSQSSKADPAKGDRPVPRRMSHRLTSEPNDRSSLSENQSRASRSNSEINDNGKRPILDEHVKRGDESIDLDDRTDPDTHFNAGDEIEKLRTRGSLTQNPTEVSRMRNLQRIQMGTHEIEPWYFSPYPQKFAELDMIYICEFCLSYSGSLRRFTRHRLKCTLRHPPGNEIYRDDHVSFFEIDGRRQRTWCRHLCLLSKLFLDHKALYYDVDPFLFYCMCVRDQHGYHLVGYFSKEKESADGYNVACILTLPQYQRKGFGKLLIAFSYELSKREGKLGSPEKPLSDLGLLSYRAYWQETIMELLLEGRTELNIEELGNRAAMTTTDVLHTLQYLNMIRTGKSNQFVIVLPDAVVEQHLKQQERQKVKGKRFIDPQKLHWKPLTFTAASRTWNW